MRAVTGRASVCPVSGSVARTLSPTRTSEIGTSRPSAIKTGVSAVKLFKQDLAAPRSPVAPPFVAGFGAPQQPAAILAVSAVEPGRVQGLSPGLAWVWVGAAKTEGPTRFWASATPWPGVSASSARRTARRRASRRGHRLGLSQSGRLVAVGAPAGQDAGDLDGAGLVVEQHERSPVADPQAPFGGGPVSFRSVPAWRGSSARVSSAW